ncbi:hypothetical protein ABK040_009485 [Willaertia magna]
MDVFIENILQNGYQKEVLFRDSNLDVKNILDIVDYNNGENKPLNKRKVKDVFYHLIKHSFINRYYESKRNKLKVMFSTANNYDINQIVNVVKSSILFLEKPFTIESHVKNTFNYFSNNYITFIKGFVDPLICCDIPFIDEERKELSWKEFCNNIMQLVLQYNYNEKQGFVDLLIIISE